jgi:hypothetical protein
LDIHGTQFDPSAKLINYEGGVLFPARAGDVVFLGAAYFIDDATMDAGINISKLGVLIHRTFSIALVHPGPSNDPLNFP